LKYSSDILGKICDNQERSCVGLATKGTELAVILILFNFIDNTESLFSGSVFIMLKFLFIKKIKVLINLIWD